MGALERVIRWQDITSFFVTLELNLRSGLHWPICAQQTTSYLLLYSSRIELRIEDAKFEPHAEREFIAKLGESIKKIEDGGFELAFGAVKVRWSDYAGQFRAVV